MCGIAAIFGYHTDAPPVDRGELLRIRDRMIPRGPDGHGDWISDDGRVGLGHRRLSIIDLDERAAQPMFTTDGRVGIVLNGEIYNYKALRQELSDRFGTAFRTTSDTEVLLWLYVHRGKAMLELLRGMYAFAIWDARKNGLFLARDPFGIKPLYYADDGRTVRIASQVKALLAGKGIDTAPDPAGHVGFFLWGHVPDPFTLHRSVRALPAGTSLWIDGKGPRAPRPFCAIPDELARASRNGHEPATAPPLRETLLDSVRHHLIADVPVGVFLSSGLDSTTLAALCAEAGGRLRTVTLGFREFRGTENDETPLAELVAKRYDTEHRTVWVEKREFEEDLDRILDAMDQPSIDGVNTWFVSKAAARTGLRVAISGLGGDELFGGYPSFRQIPKLVKAVRPMNGLPGIGEMFRRVAEPVFRKTTSPKYAGVLRYGGSYGGAYLLRRGLFMPWEIPQIVGREMFEEGWRALETMERLAASTADINAPDHRVSALEMDWYMKHQLLRDADWAGMAHSLEIRVPFLDVPLMRRVLQNSNDNQPIRKRNVAETPRLKLPDSVLEQKKSAFWIPPQWFSHGTANNERGLRGWALALSDRTSLKMEDCILNQNNKLYEYTCTLN